MNSHRRTPISLLLVLCMVPLTACVPPGSGPSASPDPGQETPSPSATSPSPTQSALDPDILFRISVTAHDPNGAVADLVQTVYKPQSTTSNMAADLAELDNQCTGWQSAYPNPQYVETEIDVTDQSPDGASWGSGPVAIVSMDGAPVFSGNFTTFQAYCASVGVMLGNTHGITPVASGNPDAIRGWAQVLYGFGVATDPQFDLTTVGPYVTFTDCQIELSQFAIDNSAVAASWAGATQTYPLYVCSFGEAITP